MAGKTGRKSNLRERIIELMSDGKPYRPVVIAEQLKASKNTVKVMVSRMVKQGELKRLPNMRGYYVIADAGIVEVNNKKNQYYTVPPFEIHGVKFELDLKRLETHSICNFAKTGSNLDSISDFVIKAFKEKYFIIPDRVHRKNHAHYKQIEYPINGRSIWITVTIHEGKLIEVWVKSSKEPLILPEYIELTGWLTGTFPCTTLEDWKLTEIGINEDYKNVKLDGITNMTVQASKNELYRIYYKREIGATRRELHYSTKRKEANNLKESLETFMGYSPEIIEKNMSKMIEEKHKELLQELRENIQQPSQGMEELIKNIERINSIEQEIENQKQELTTMVADLQKNDNLIAMGISKILDILGKSKMEELEKLKKAKEEVEKLKEQGVDKVEGYQ